MHGHPYMQRATATHVVVTSFGTFHLCPSCVNEQHAGLKFGNTAVRLPADAAARACDCEHIDHVGESRDGGR
jgi:hypothetical protein